MSFTKVDLPEPDTPVTATNKPNGISTSISFRLFSLAPFTVNLRFGSTGRRMLGISIALRPEIYAPVIESLLLINSS